MKPSTPFIASALALSLLAFQPRLAAQGTPAFSVVHSFSAGRTEGAEPKAGLIQGSDGDFYGVAYIGGSQGAGTVFRLTPDGNVSALYNFGSAQDSAGHNNDGTSPHAALIQGQDGNFYGTTETGGPNNDGMVFRLSPGGVYTKMHAFALTHQSIYNNAGAYPLGGVIQDRNGNLYGTTGVGGQYAGGSVYRLTTKPGDVIKILRQLGADSSEGALPMCDLIQGRDGAFYGTTQWGGPANTGAVFKITAAGVLTTLRAFSAEGGNNQDGTFPQAGLVEGRDGNFYGTTKFGGAANEGTVFQITPAGVLTTLHVFSAYSAGMKNSDGAQPIGALIQGRDGNLYGTTSIGGTDGEGTVFSITTGGAFTTLHHFTALAGDEKSNSDGAGPVARLLQAADGTLYGTASLGGVNGNGTIFALAVSPTITSAASARAQVGRAFSYQIAADNHPASYGAANLPGGLTVNTQTGLITGTPTAAGNFTVTLAASNGAGSGAASLTLTVQAAGTPYITSAATATATMGAAVSYQITASNRPTGYGVLGLPPGLHVDGKTGLVTGTPTTSGTKTLTLKAVNAAGTGQATLMLTITPK